MLYLQNAKYVQREDLGKTFENVLDTYTSTCSQNILIKNCFPTRGSATFLRIGEWFVIKELPCINQNAIKSSELKKPTEILL